MITHSGEFIVMDVTVDGDLSTAFSPGYDPGSSGGGPHHQDPTKKPTFAEKLMGVKNTQCDQFLSRMQTSISTEENHHMVKLREDANKVRYDYKEIDLIKKRRELERKKKKYPLVDTEEDEFELARIERYLFYNPNHCFYMEKKNSIPLRGTAKSDPYYITQTVARARKMLQDFVNERSVEAIQEKRATMLSRKSTRSVHFQDVEENSENSNPQRADSPSKARSQSAQKRSRSESPTKNRVQSRPKSMYSTQKGRQSGSLLRIDSEEPEMTKQEQLLAYLRSAKADKERMATLILGEHENNQDDDIPDDYTQCEQSELISRQSRSRSRRSRLTPNDLDNVFDETSTVPKPSSGYSRRSHATGASELESTVHFPSITGEQHKKDANGEDIPDHAQFGGLEELPPHEIALLKAVEKHPPCPPERERPIQSEVIRRTIPTQSSYRRYTSSSAHPLKRRQVTHAMLRREKAEVEVKVNQFLDKFDDGNKRKHYRVISLRPSQATFEFKQQSTDGVVANTPNGIGSIPEPQENRTTSPTKTGHVKFQNPPQTPAVPPTSGLLPQSASPRTPHKPRTPRGPPTNSLNRAKRHTATFKLRKMVDELMRNRTTVQQMEHEKMLAARINGGKTPDLHNIIDRDSPPYDESVMGQQ